MEPSLLKRDIMVVGASSGGIETLVNLVGGLPPDLPAAVFVVVHLPPASPSALPKILDRSGPLQAVRCEDGERIEPGRIYVAQPDLHLLIEDGHVRVVRGPKENRHRPAADTLFRSAAVVYGPRVVGVILSGALNDGTVGLAAIKRRGGVAVVQDPDDALFSGMARSALEHVNVDHCLPLSGIAPLLARIVQEKVIVEEGAYPVPDDMELEDGMARLDTATPENVAKLGQPSAFTCPECDGPLWEIRDEEVLRFRCRVGHAYTGESMLAEKTEALEGALWAALNTLEEGAEMSRRLAAQARARGAVHAAMRFEERAQKSKEQVTLLRQALANGPANTTEDAV
jgi:two-component system, chemotaxis family, protein-glutamate methylesterase/glutaminase